MKETHRAWPSSQNNPWSQAWKKIRYWLAAMKKTHRSWPSSQNNPWSQEWRKKRYWLTAMKVTQPAWPPSQNNTWSQERRKKIYWLTSMNETHHSWPWRGKVTYSQKGDTSFMTLKRESDVQPGRRHIVNDLQEGQWLTARKETHRSWPSRGKVTYSQEGDTSIMTFKRDSDLQPGRRHIDHDLGKVTYSQEGDTSLTDATGVTHLTLPLTTTVPETQTATLYQTLICSFGPLAPVNSYHHCENGLIWGIMMSKPHHIYSVIH